MPVNTFDSIGLAFYHYNVYAEGCKKKGETPLTMRELIFGKRK